jgi:hypothetical protein
LFVAIGQETSFAKAEQVVVVDETLPQHDTLNLKRLGTELNGSGDKATCSLVLMQHKVNDRQLEQCEEVLVSVRVRAQD